MANRVTDHPKILQRRIVSGSVILLSGSGLTAAINFAYNIAVARFLGAAGYGHAAVVYTLLTLLSAITLSFQIVASKVVAQQKSPEDKAAVYRSIHRTAWGCGVLVAVILLLFRASIADYLNLPLPGLIALVSIGAAFYVPLGSRRGYIQGTYGFRRLAVNLALEAAVRLGGSLVLMLLGFGVQGVIVANSAAMAVAYFAAASRLAPRVPNPMPLRLALRETSQALVFFSGQVLINNCDIVLVKHFFPAPVAGLYAAIAMVGRVIYSLSSAVVNTTFPIVAGTEDEARRDLRVIATSLILVVCIGSVIALGLVVAPVGIWTALFGAKFQIAGIYNMSYLLALYALVAVVYSLSAVVITFEMSYKIANTSWIQLAFSGIVIAGICRFHASLHQVIMVQLILLLGLFVMVALPFLSNSLTVSKSVSAAGSGQPVTLVRRVAEDEVICEFLRSDFHLSAFRDYRETMRKAVNQPNYLDADQNVRRRALFYIRHLSLWRELPRDTVWYEVELNESDIRDIRVFPRAQWRKLARGNFSITEVVERMRSEDAPVDAQFIAKVKDIGAQISSSEAGMGAVILIGRREDEPLTVLDGNHRLVAAMLASPNQIGRLRFLCGLSARMTDCCWYNSNLINLSRYTLNVLAHAVHRPEAELVRILRTAPPADAVVEA